MTVFGVLHEADEGTAAQIFQLRMVAQLPIAACFEIKWLPRQPKQSLLILVLQAGAWLAAITHLTKCLVLEWAPYSILVNAVAPTLIATPGTKKWLDDSAFCSSIHKRIPLGCIGKPKEVVEPLVFLASPTSLLITGETIVVDGGWTIQ